MTTEPNPHIQFAPLILPRKTPAEEITEAMAMLDADDPRPAAVYGILHQVRERLATPDAPKRWDGVFPWSRQTYGGGAPMIAFGDSLGFYPATNSVTSSPLLTPSDKTYYDGVIITITAGSGDEFPRMLKDSTDTLYICLGEGGGKCVIVSDGPWGRYRPGHVDANWDGAEHGKPLPPGTVARITINNTLPTTEQRYSVEVVEPEQPKFATHSLLDGDAVVSVQDGKVVNYQPNRRTPMTPLEARQVIAALTAAANHLDPQEQPATEAVAEGLPLEIGCLYAAHDTLTFENSDEPDALIVHPSRYTHFFLSPADEARLRNLLNQRAEGGGE